MTATLRPFSTGLRFPIFVSCGDEAVPLKDKLKALVENAFESQFSLKGFPHSFPVWHWSDSESAQAPEGGKVNDRFVAAARTSSVTIVLLRNRIPAGTEEEFLAVKDDRDVELKVLWFPDVNEEGEESEVGEFLAKYKNDLVYVRILGVTGEADELETPDEFWVAVTKEIVSIVLRAIRSDERRPFVEGR